MAGSNSRWLIFARVFGLSSTELVIILYNVQFFSMQVRAKPQRQKEDADDDVFFPEAEEIDRGTNWLGSSMAISSILLGCLERIILFHLLGFLLSRCSQLLRHPIRLKMTVAYVVVPLPHRGPSSFFGSRASNRLRSRRWYAGALACHVHNFV